MVPSMNQTDLVSVEYVLPVNMPRSTLTRDGSTCYGPFINRTELVSVEYELSGNISWSNMTRDGSICYGPFDESKGSGECWVTTL